MPTLSLNQSHVHVDEPRQHHIHRCIQDRSRTEKQIKETRGREPLCKGSTMNASVLWDIVPRA